MPKPMPLELKPDIESAAERWNAYFAGELIDRPLLWITAPVEDAERVKGVSYHEWIYGDIDDNIERTLKIARARHWLGEAVPTFYPSFGPDEIGVYTGSELVWSEDSPGTNWIVPYVDDWEEVLPLEIKADNYYWTRKLEILRRGADRLAGKTAMCPLDFHSNMGLLAAIRGSERLCTDLVDRPDIIDRAMESSRALYPQMWRATTEAGRMYELGFSQCCYSMEGAACVECDFSCMISQDMFKRWVLPALEEEAGIVKHPVYHWDGPGALTHTDALIDSTIHTLSFLPGTGNGASLDYLDLLKHIQSRGKAIHAGGTVDELKQLHRELDPAKVVYFTSVATPAESEQLMAWFVKNT